VKKFKFALDSVRGFRQARLEEEEARLQMVLAERRELIARGEDLERREVETMDRIRELRVVEVDELMAVDAFRRYAGRERRRLKGAVAEVSGRVERQRDAVVEAQRQVEMLNRLREKRMKAWRAEVDREMEDAVAELVIARWSGAGG